MSLSVNSKQTATRKIGAAVKRTLKRWKSARSP